ncbi:BatD family protein [Rhodothermus profundi]|uniref:Oxygen tolerance n=1 Tax=Rhodothermus profundi TaxID=633813 RepID=A0A1M6RTM0_9BACT|nr:BatD family protein [Rhodothermus profundi]SHK35780.1 Oxygen tolerance [Rhodothermus profundi]
MRRGILLLLLIGAWTTSGAAQQQTVELQARVSRTQIGMGETVVYTVEVIGTLPSALRMPEPPPTEGLALVYPMPTVHRQYSLTGGRIQQRIRYSWRFRPVRPGKARIGAFQLQVGDQILTTDPIELTIYDAPTAPPAEALPEAVASAPDLFIEATLRPTTPYEQQQTVLEYRLFFREGLQVWRSRLVGSWETEGFWREELKVEDRPLPERVLRHGIPYYTFVLQRIALFPTRSGTLRIDPLTIESEVSVQPDPLDPFATLLHPSQSEPRRIAAPALAVSVRPLPKGAPPAFIDAVGQFRLEAAAAPTAVSVGEPVTITLRLSGTGNLPTLTPPRLHLDSSFAVYPADDALVLDRRGPRLSGTRTLTYVLVPHQADRLTLPPVRFTYFDPEARAYRTLTASLPALVVRPAPVSSPASPVATSSPEAAPFRWYRLLPYAGGSLLLLAFLLWIWRRRGASPQVRPSATQAATLPPSTLEPRLFYRRLEEALRQAAGRYLGQDARGLTRSHLCERLRQQGLPEAEVVRMARLLAACEAACYAPTPPDPAQTLCHHREAVQLLQYLNGKALT